MPAHRSAFGSNEPRRPINIERDVILLLTASIDVKGMSSSSRPDPLVRQNDYAEAVIYYLTHHPRIRRLVFVENSGWPLEQIRGRALANNPFGKQLEFISLDCNDFPREFGKSYGELMLIERCMDVSHMVRDARYVVKLTGRNQLVNLTALLRTFTEPLDAACDVAENLLYEKLRPNCTARWCESRVFLFTRAFFDRHLRGKYHLLDESRTTDLERFLYTVVKPLEQSPTIISRFRIEPYFRGLAGHLNKNYSSPAQNVRKAIRGLLRRVAPSVRI
jgi:hypothetical protein